MQNNIKEDIFYLNYVNFIYKIILNNIFCVQIKYDYI